LKKIPEGQSPKDLIRLLHELEYSEEAKQQPVAGAELDPQLAWLRQWQSKRLASTYADLLKDPHYAPICGFFLSDIYAARDFSQRDQDAEHLYSLLSRYLPAVMLTLLADIIHVNKLTSLLDYALLRALIEELHIVDTITPQDYAQAYRICDNYAERKLQIELLVKCLHEVGKGAHNLLVELSLRVAKLPAQHAGWFDLYDFLERGYAACKPARNFEFFVKTIEGRETAILDRIYASDPNPFNINGEL
jgi:hypothetical protein